MAYKATLHMIKDHIFIMTQFKGIVSRDFGGLHIILMDRIGVPDVPLKVYSFLNFRFHIVILVQSF